MHMALNNWGNALLAQAKTKQGEAADRLFEAAYQKYAEALKLKPDMHEALNNWGNALGAQAKTKQGEAADRLFEAAYQKYAEALKLKPDCTRRSTTGAMRWVIRPRPSRARPPTGCLRRRIRSMPRPSSSSRTMHEALNNWGVALGDQAKTKQGEAADRLFEAAYQKYAEALKLKPDNHEALNNWGACCLTKASQNLWALASSCDGPRAKNCSPPKTSGGSAAYNLARVEAGGGKVADAITGLQKYAASGGQLSRKKLGGNADFDPIRNAPAFSEFLQSLPEA